MMTAFAMLLALSMTGQVISHATPKPGDLVVLVSSRPISIWSEPALIGQPTDQTVTSGTFATCLAVSPIDFTVKQTHRYRNVAPVLGTTKGNAAAAELINNARRMAIPMATEYYVTVSRRAGTDAAPGVPGFTCLSRDAYIVANVDTAKAAYRDIAGQLAKIEAKPHPGNKKHASALAARDMAKLQNELMARYGLNQTEFQALMTCGQANHWDDAKPAKKEVKRPITRSLR
jgi:hypothetical protein